MKIDINKLRQDFDKPHYVLEVSDGTTLFIREWKPAKDSKIAILILHGITAYSDIYGEELSETISEAGYSTYGLDLRGHGLSEGIRGDYPGKECLIKDICETISFIKEKKEKLILLGHSLGVISAIIAVNNCKEKIDGLILLSAGRKIREGIYAKPSVLKILKIFFNALLYPSKPVINYYREGLTGLDDPLRNFSYTLRFMRIFSAKDLKFPEKLEIPVLIGVGDEDEIFEVDSSRALYEEVPSDNKEFMIIEGAKHAEFPKNSWTRLIKWLDLNYTKK